jgi:hypothetical protein
VHAWSDPDTVRWSDRIVASYHARTGEDLLGGDGRPDDRAGPAMSRRLYELPAVVLCHDGAADPVFVYANAAACALWRMPREDLVGMHSRLSAGPDQRGSRSAMLDQARGDGLLRGYHGIRQARDGSRFEIRDAVVWTVDDEAGRPVGQAATFTESVPLPQQDRPTGPPGEE